jgi:hypothetical protein
MKTIYKECLHTAFIIKRLEGGYLYVNVNRFLGRYV